MSDVGEISAFRRFEALTAVITSTLAFWVAI
jgi:hypothetical protein